MDFLLMANFRMCPVFFLRLYFSEQLFKTSSSLLFFHFWYDRKKISFGLLLFKAPCIHLTDTKSNDSFVLLHMICCRSRIKLRNGMHLFTDTYKKDIIKHHFPLVTSGFVIKKQDWKLSIFHINLREERKQIYGA